MTSLRRHIRKVATDITARDADVEDAVAQLRASHGPLAVTALSRHLRKSGWTEAAEAVEGAESAKGPSSILRHPSQWGKRPTNPG